MKKIGFFILVILYVAIQACGHTTPTQWNHIPTATLNSVTLARDVTPSLTKKPSPTSTSLQTPTPTVKFEDLELIDTSNISALVMLKEYYLDGDYATALHWSQDSKKIHVLKYNGEIGIWDIETGLFENFHKRPDKNKYSVGWDPENGIVVLVDKPTTELTVWDSRNDTYLFSLGLHTNPFVNSQSVSWSPDGTKIVSSGWDDTLRVWDASSGQLLRTINSKSSWFEGITWSSGETYIAVGHKNGAVYIVNVDSWRITRTLLGHNGGHEGGVPVVSWSPDGTKIVSGGRDEHKIIIWSSEGKMLYELSNQPLSVFGLAWSPDSTMIAASGEGWDVVITDATKGVEVFRLGNHKPNTYCVSWSPNGKMLATISSEGAIRVWGIYP